MLINEVSKVTGLTKKAIEYYTEQRLIFPSFLENGYRDFSEEHIDILKKISILRKLEVSINDISRVLMDETGNVLSSLAIKKELDIQRQKAHNALLEKLINQNGYELVAKELELLNQSTLISEKLLEAFPGYYGRFISLHFARFLNDPIINAQQQIAYDKIIAFLDNMPPFNMPCDLQDYLMEGTRDITTKEMNDMFENINQTFQNPDKYLKDNKEILEKYLAYKDSDEYKNSPAYKISEFTKKFDQTSGYYDVFIPAMKEISSTYVNYYIRMIDANELMLTMYPNAIKLNN